MSKSIKLAYQRYWDVYFFVVVLMTTLGLYRFLRTTRTHLGEIDSDWFNWKYWTATAERLSCDLSIIDPFTGQGGLSFPICHAMNPSYWIAVFFPGYFEPVSQTTTLFLSNVALLVLFSVLKLRLFPALIALLLYNTLATSIFGSDASFFIFEHLTAAHSLNPLAISFIVASVQFSNQKTRQGKILYILLSCLLFLWGVLINPLYAMIYYAMPIFFVFLYHLLFTENKKQSLTFIVSFPAIVILTGVPIFYIDYLTVARSFFGAEIYSEIQKIDYLNVVFFRYHSKISALITLAYLISVGSLFFLKRDKKITNLCMILSAMMLLVGFLYTFSGMKWKYPSPVYLEQSIIFIYILPISLATFGIVSLFPQKVIASFLRLAEFRYFAYPILLIATFTLFYQKHSSFTQNDLETYHVSQPLTTIQYSHSEGYNGSLATIIGVPGSEVGIHLGYKNSENPIDKNHIMVKPKLLQEYYEEYYSMTNLMVNKIPIAEDNNHMVSPFKYYFFSRLLSRSHDYHSRNFLYISEPNIDVLKLIGVKYVLSDLILDLKILHSNFSKNFTIRLYEMDNSNLGNYYPTSIQTAKSAEEIIEKIRSVDLEEVVIIHENDEFMKELVRGKTHFFGFNGYDDLQFRGESIGTSLVILPIEYRNSLVAKGQGKFVLIRTNLFLTGVLYEGEIDIQISSEKNFFNISKAFETIFDITNHNFKKDKSRYPYGYQPLSLF